jgi:hypothetical protein
MSHHFAKQIRERDLKQMQEKTPPKECEKCKEPGFMNLIEVAERINSYDEEKRVYEYTDTSRYTLYRCISCNFEEVAK